MERTGISGPPFTTTLDSMQFVPIAALVLIGLACAAFALVMASRRACAAERLAKANGSYAGTFVWVEDDGSVRELTADERSYLNTEFHPTDGARPYIKSRYSSRSTDHRISGFLSRNKVPRRLVVHANGSMSGRGDR